MQNAKRCNRIAAARARLRIAVLVGVLALPALLSGCRPPLFGPNEDRSQYDRFDAIRDQRAPPFLEDEFGYQRPNLRGRLMPRD